MGSVGSAQSQLQLLDPKLAKHLVPLGENSMCSSRLPLLAGLSQLLPEGALKRGASYCISGLGKAAFAMALACEAAKEGAFIAVVDDGSFGWAACAESGIAPEQVVGFKAPAPDRLGHLLAALLEGFEVVILTAGHLNAVTARNLQARLRERSAVLLVLVQSGYGPSHAAFSSAKPAALSPRARFDLGLAHWDGLGSGHGFLQARRLLVHTNGKGLGAGRSHLLWLPDEMGEVRLEALKATHGETSVGLNGDGLMSKRLSASATVTSTASVALANSEAPAAVGHPDAASVCGAAKGGALVGRELRDAV